MFNNIASKIKLLAKVCVFVGSIFFIIFGLVLIFRFEDPDGWFYVFFGPILVWVSCFVLYGFGQLVDNSDKLVALNSEGTSKLKREIKKDAQQTIKQSDATTSKKANWDIKTEEDNQYKKIFEMIKDITEGQLDDLKKHYKNWYSSIQNIPENKLLNIINNERDAWEKEYIDLCCVVLLERLKKK